jgi:DNA-directed RNA polymerase specialized sigma24 family protein
VGRVRDTPGVRRHDEIERLYREQGSRMWRALLAFAGDPEVASDAVAEAFAQALRRGGEIRDPKRWLWRAAFRIAAGELKERRRAAPGVAKEKSYELEEPARELIAALAKLSVKQRGGSGAPPRCRVPGGRGRRHHRLNGRGSQGSPDAGSAPPT